MTLPNWMIRCIIAILFFPIILAAVALGAWDYVFNEAVPEIKEAWKHPEGTRWGSERNK